MKTLRIACAAVLLLAAAGGALAQGYPAKPVRFVVSFAPGGAADVVGRFVAQRMSEQWGQQIVVENRAGAGGSIAALAVARAPADGYTVLVTTSALAVTPALNPNAGYDAEKDLIAVTLLASSPNMFAASNASGIRTLREAIDKAKTGKLNYGTAGAGTTPHLSAEYLFKVLGKVDVQHVPYKGAGPAMQALVAGETELASVAMSAAVPQVKAGRAVGLAVTSAKRTPALPDVPTVAESGFPGFEDYTWVGFFVPAGTPPEIVARLNEEAQRSLKSPELRDKLAGVGFDAVVGTGPREFAPYLKEELAKWAKVVKETGAKAE
jgi:tripartite-type tricarboxylate transporter receptor subunit TctC